jgi:hypothetical protein
MMRDAVVADRSADTGSRRRPRAVARISTPRHDAHAGRVDEDAVALALLDDLGVAGDDRNARLLDAAAPSTRRSAQLRER